MKASGQDLIRTRCNKKLPWQRGERGFVDIWMFIFLPKAATQTTRQLRFLLLRQGLLVDGETFWKSHWDNSLDKLIQREGCHLRERRGEFIKQIKLSLTLFLIGFRVKPIKWLNAGPEILNGHLGELKPGS